LQNNAEVIRDIVPQVMENVDAKNVILILVTNPLDVMVMLAREISKLPASRVIGTGTMLDTARLRTILSRGLSVSPQSIHSYVLGEHGDSSVIDWSSVTVGGLSLDDFCTQTKVPMTDATRETIEYRVRNAAYEIIRGRGATWDGIGAAVSDLLRCIINDEHRILTVSVVDGVGSHTLAMSLPRVVGRGGVITTLIPKMSSAELAALRRSARIIQKNFSML
jgi:L-lactate dehydrogenase